MQTTSTFSIIGYDEQTGELGVAVQSKFLAVGSLCSWVKSGVGAVGTQALTNSTFGYKSFEMLENGLCVKDIRDKLIENDDNKDIRQFAIIDAHGNTAAYTGSGCLPYADHVQGKNFSCQGNFLHNKIVLEEMAKAFESCKGDLSEKLISALIAAQEHGGEKRGQQSAALIVKRANISLIGEMDVVVDLRVDEHISPICELKRLLQKHRVLFSKNHFQKWFPFKGDTKQALIEIINTINLCDMIVDGRELSISDLLFEYGKMEQIEAFQGENINGALVDSLVNRYYAMQED